MPNPGELRVAIVGAGPGGICMAIRLKGAGFGHVTVLEKAGGVGGTWYHNRYPGCACDVPAHLYSYSFEPKSDWSRPFASQPEILGYFEGCAAKYGVLPHCRFGDAVTSARWDEAATAWTLELASGRMVRADVGGDRDTRRPRAPRRHIDPCDRLPDDAVPFGDRCDGPRRAPDRRRLAPGRAGLQGDRDRRLPEPFFMLYGPNTNSDSILTLLEYQADYVLRQVQRFVREGLAWIDVRPAAMAEYNEELQRDIATIEPWQAGCADYYRGADGRIVTQWPRSMRALEEALAGLDEDAYDVAVRPGARASRV